MALVRFLIGARIYFCFKDNKNEEQILTFHSLTIFLQSTAF